MIKKDEGYKEGLLVLLSNGDEKGVSYFLERNRLTLVYEAVMFTLAIISVSFIWVENASLKFVDTAIWGIFVIDVSARFIKSENKLEYIKKNPFDIIAIIPFDSIFRLARLVRLIRVIRALTIAKRFAGPFFGILKTNGLEKVIAASAILILIAAVPIRFVEPSINTYADAIWWSSVTATAIGYEAAETVVGRLIAAVLMIVGIGLLGMITGSIATYFIKGAEKEDPTIAYMKGQMDRLDELNEREIDAIIAILKTSKKKIIPSKKRTSQNSFINNDQQQTK